MVRDVPLSGSWLFGFIPDFLHRETPVDNVSFQNSTSLTGSCFSTQAPVEEDEDGDLDLKEKQASHLN